MTKNKYKRFFSVLTVMLVALVLTSTLSTFIKSKNENNEEIYTYLNYTFSGTFMSEAGSINDPYVISQDSHMFELANLVNSGTSMLGKYFVVDSSIDSIDLENFIPIGTEAKPFSGNFNGNGAQFNLNINQPNLTFVGLFGYATSGKIENLSISGEVIGNQYVGSVLGYNNGATVNNIYNHASITGNANYVGGLVGGVLRGTLSNSLNKGLVKGGNYVGGIIGYGYRYSRHASATYYNNTLSNLYNAGVVLSKGTSVNLFMGGRSDNYYSSYNQLNPWSNIYMDVNGSMEVIDHGTHPYKDKTVRNDSNYLNTQQFIDGSLDLANFTNGYIRDNFGYYPQLNYFVSHPNIIIRERMKDVLTISLADGIGSEENPYLISTNEDLIDMSNRVNQGNTYERFYFKVERINSSFLLTEWIPIGLDLKPFYGNFDGNYSEFEIYINEPTKDYQAFFGQHAKGTIKNFNVSGEITGRDFTAGIVGRQGYGESLGNLGGQLLNVYNKAIINGRTYTGGIVGYQNSGIIRSTFNMGSISAIGNYTGGIAGFMYGSNVSATLEESFNHGRIKGINYVGGITGYYYQYYRHSNTGFIYSSLKNTYNSGLVSGQSSVFGIIGYTNVNYYSSYNGQNPNSNNIYDDSINSLFIPESGIKPAPLTVNGLKTDILLDQTQMTNRGFLPNYWSYLEKTESTSFYPQLKNFTNSEVLRIINDMNHATFFDTKDGLGTLNTPFLIRTKDDMDTLSTNVLLGNNYENYYFKVADGIDIIDLEDFMPIGSPAKPFRGNFDGNGVNFNLSINRTLMDNVGIFGYADKGEIKNISTSGTVIGRTNVGSVIGQMDGVNVNNVYNTANINGINEVGGNVGRVNRGNFINAYNLGEVSGTNNIGGNVGYSLRYYRHSSSTFYYNSLVNLYNAGSVKAISTTVGGNIGGINQTYYSSYSQTNTWQNNLYDASMISFAQFDSNYPNKPISVPNSNEGVINRPVASLLSYQVNGFINEDANETFAYFPELAYFKNNKNEQISKRSTLTAQYSLSDGLGTKEHPFKIYNENDLWELSNDVKQGATFEGFYFKVVDTDSKFVLNNWQPIGDLKTSFLGSFDGSWSNFEINIDAPTLDYQGLFGVVALGEIKNITISGSINARNYVGALAGRTGFGKNNTNLGGNIYNIYNEAIIHANSYVGGIVGLQESGDIKSVFNTANITTLSNYTGGIIGFMNGFDKSANLSDAFNTGNIKGLNYVGGITGYFYQYYRHASATFKYSSLKNTYNVGLISGQTSVFGVIGFTNLNYYSSYNGQNPNSNNTYDVSINALFIPESGIKPSALAANGITSNIYFDRTSMVNRGLSESNWTFKNKDEVNGYYPQLSAFVNSNVKRVSDLSLAAVSKNIEGGLGTKDSPYIIETAEDMYLLSQNVNLGNTYENYYFKVKDGIDQIILGDFSPIGKTAKPFRGHFDGNYADFNLSINKPNESQVALFGFMDKGSISNLSISGTITGLNFVSGVLAESHGGEVHNVYNTARILGTNNIGGINGYLREGVISFASNFGIIEGTNYVGGITGNTLQYYRHSSATFYYSTIKDVFNAGIVRAKSTYVGGIWGYLNPAYYSSYNQQNTRLRAYYDTSVITSSEYSNDFKYVPNSVPQSTVNAVTTEDLMKLKTSFATGFISHNMANGYGYYPQQTGFNKSTNELIVARIMETTQIELSKGLGTIEYPYIITTKTDMDNLSINVSNGITYKGAYFKISDDILSIDLGNFAPIGKDGIRFEGNFNGNFKELVINTVTTQSTFGLFADLAGRVENLIISGSIESTGSYGGIVAGKVTGGTISNVFINANIKGLNYIGGIAGMMTGGLIEKSAHYGNINGQNYVGGILGHLHTGKMSNLYARSTIIANAYVGGIVGHAYLYSRISASVYTSNSIISTYSASLVSSKNSYIDGNIGFNDLSRYSNSGANTRSNNYYDASILVSFKPEGGFKPSSVISQTALEKTSMIEDQLISKGFSDSVWKFNISEGNDSYYPQIISFTNPKNEKLFNLSKLSVTTTPLLGDGSLLNPYRIRTNNDMLNLEQSLLSGFDTTNIYYIVDNNISQIDLSDTNFNGIGTLENPFKGSFNGNYADFKLNIKSSNNYTGLFNYTDVDAYIHKLSVSGEISGKDYTGSLVGYNQGLLEEAYSTASVNGNNYVGGLVGFNTGSIKEVYKINSQASLGGDYIGGLVGFNTGNITDGYVNGETTGVNYIGGLVGSNQGSVSHLYYNRSIIEALETNQNKPNQAVGNEESSLNVLGLAREDLMGKNIIGTNINQLAFESTRWTEKESIGLFNYTLQLNGFNKSPLTHTAVRSETSVRVIRFEEGNGTKNNPYIINNEEEMALLSLVSQTDSLLNIYFKVTDHKDIFDLSNIDLNYLPIGNQNTMFRGGFDGNNKTFIIGVDKENNDYQGLFGALGPNSEIKNIHLTGNLKARYFVGALAGLARNSSISNISSDVVVNGQRQTGGLIGQADQNTVITYAFNKGNITGNGDTTGGIVGFALTNVKISYVFNYGMITGRTNTGGIAGAIQANTILQYAYNTGEILATGVNTGGIVGLSKEKSVVDNVYQASIIRGINQNNTGSILGLSQTQSVETNAYFDLTLLLSDARLNGVKPSKAVGNKLNQVDVKGVTKSEITGLNILNNDNNQNNKLSLDSNVWSLTESTDLVVYYPQLNYFNESDNLNFVNGSLESTRSLLFDGTGTLSNPFIIYSVYDMKSLANAVNNGIDFTDMYFMVHESVTELDLTIKDLNFMPIGTIDNPFNGSFDGNYVNIKLALNNEDNQALFTKLGPNSEVKNISLSGFVEGRDYLGSLAVYNFGLIDNVYSTVTIKGSNYIGGLVAINEGMIKNVYVHADLVSLNNYAGGLVSLNLGVISDGYFAGQIEGVNLVGALIGYTDNSNLMNLYYDTDEVNHDATKILNAVSNLDENANLKGVQKSLLTNELLVKNQLITLNNQMFESQQQLSFSAYYPQLKGFKNNSNKVIQNNSLLSVTVNRLKGNGEENNPYLIKDSFDMKALSDLVNISNLSLENKYIKVVDGITHIDLSDYQLFYQPIGSINNPFKGYFNGNHAVFTINFKNYEAYAGLFGVIGQGAVVENTHVDGLIDGGRLHGGISGRNQGTIKNSSSSVNIISTTNLNENAYAGGITAYNEGLLLNVFNTGNISALYNYVAGIAAYNAKTASIINAYNTGIIKTPRNYAGGIAAYHEGMIQNVYNRGYVEGYYAGMIIGTSNQGQAVNMYYDKTEIKMSQNSLKANQAINSKKDDDKVLALSRFEFSNSNLFNLNLNNDTFTFNQGTQDLSYYPELKVFSQLNIPHLNERSLLSVTSNRFIGLGTSDLPYLLLSETDLINLSLLIEEGFDTKDNYFKVYLANEDFNLIKYQNLFKPIGNHLNPFNGYFDGNNVDITLKINNDLDYQALFGYQGQNSIIKNLNTHGSIKAKNFVGSVVSIQYGTLSNVKNYASIEGKDNVGGITANAFNELIASINFGDIKANDYVGGITGFLNNDASINNSNNEGLVTGNDYVGGLVGKTGFNTSINYSYSTNQIHAKNYVGGLIGYNEGLLHTSYNASRIFGHNYIGGLVGYNDGHIYEAYAREKIFGNLNIGGLIGYNKGTYDAIYYNESIILDDRTETILNKPIKAISNEDVQLNLKHQDMTGLYAINTNDSKMNFDHHNWVLKQGNDFTTYYPELKINNESLDNIRKESSKLSVTYQVFEGDGSKDNPYLIYDGYDMELIQNYILNQHSFMNKFFEVKSGVNSIDLTLSDINYQGIGTIETKFEANFDGKNANFILNQSNVKNFGLFNYLGTNAVIKNLKVSGRIEGTSYLAGVALRNEGLIENVESFVNINSKDGNYVAGIAAINTGKIINALNRGLIDTKASFVAGIVAQNEGLIENSYNKAEVRGQNEIAGITGKNSGVIYASYNTGSIYGDSNIGGIAGENKGTIDEVFNTGSIYAKTSAAGGIAGRNISQSYQTGNINNAYNTGSIKTDGHYAGGIIGLLQSGLIDNTYNASKVEGLVDIGGIIGSMEGGLVTRSYYDQTVIDSFKPTNGNKPTKAISNQSDKVDVKALLRGHMIGLYNIGSNTNQLNFSNQSKYFKLPSYNQFSYYPQLSVFANHVNKDVQNDSLTSVTTFTFGYGNGTINDPFMIMNESDMIAFSQTVNSGNTYQGQYIKVDPALGELNFSAESDYQYMIIGNQLNSFNGYFDGSGVNLDLSLDVSLDYAAIFGKTGHDAVIKNISVTGIIKGLNYVSGIVAYNQGTINNVYNNATIIGNDYVSGISAVNKNQIYDVYNKGSIYGNQYVGAISAYLEGSISNTYNTGVIYGETYIGTIVGYIKSGTLTYSYYDLKVLNAYGTFENYKKPSSAVSNKADNETVKSLDKAFMVSKNSLGNNQLQLNINSNQSFTNDFNIDDINTNYPQLAIFSKHINEVVLEKSKQSTITHFESIKLINEDIETIIDVLTGFYFETIIPTFEGHDFIGYKDEENQVYYTDQFGKSYDIYHEHQSLTLTANYKVKTFTVDFIDGNNEIVVQRQYEHGSLIEIPLIIPMKDANDLNVFEFISWDYDFNETISSNLVINSVYDSLDRYLSVTFMNGNDEILLIQTVEYDNKVLTPLEIPFKEPFDNLGYKFISWDYDFDLNIKSNITIYPIFEEVNRYYEVTFKTINNEIINKVRVEYLESLPNDIYKQTKPMTETTTYEFIGWSESLENISKDMEVYPIFIELERLYLVEFIDGNNQIYDSVFVSYGASAYAKTGYPMKDANDLTAFEFIGWDTDLTNIKNDTKTYALYQEIERFYDLYWYDGNLNLLEITYDVEYLSKILEPNIKPVKDANQQYIYEFKAWDLSNNLVISDMHIYPDFNENLRPYIVSFIDGNGLLVDEIEVLYGQNAIDPSLSKHIMKQASSTHAYKFIGWDKDLTNITGDMTINALFEEAEKYYFVTFYGLDTNEPLSVQRIEYGFSAVEPILPNYMHEDIRYQYIFKNWDLDFSFITKDLDIYANYEEVMKSYIVTFNTGEQSIDVIVYHGASAIAPDPYKNPTDQITYEFINWDKSFTNITSNLTVNALFESVYAYYTVQFLNEDGSIFNTQQVTPNKDAINPGIPKKEAQDNLVYEFLSWDKLYTNITQNLLINPIFKTLNMYYEVNFYDDLGNLISNQTVMYKDDAIEPSAPIKNSSNQFDYVFNKWNQDTKYITTNLDIFPIYDEVLKTFVVNFYNGENEIIDTQIVNYASSAQTPSSTTKNPHDDTYYLFDKWNIMPLNVTQNLEIYPIFNEIPWYYQVNFYDELNNLIDTQMVKYNESAIDPFKKSEIKEINENQLYVLISWDKDFTSVKENLDVYGIYDYVDKNYRVNFYDDQNMLLSSQIIQYGKTALAPENPIKISDELGYAYLFMKWDSDFTYVKSNLEVYPIFDKYKQTFKVTFYDGNLNIFDTQIIEYENSAKKPNGIPSKANDQFNSYEFNNWIESFDKITSDLNVYAEFVAVDLYYIVRFIDENHLLISEQMIRPGMDAIEPIINIPNDTDAYTYSYYWSKDFLNVFENLETTLIIVETKVQYTYTFLDSFGNVYITLTGYYGDFLNEPAGPLKPMSDSHIYTFSHFSPNYEETITKDMVYTPIYKEDYRTFKVNFYDGDGKLFEVHEVLYAHATNHPENIPLKTSDKQYVYTFKSWGQLITDVKNDLDVHPIFNKELQKYIVTFIDEFGNTLKEELVNYGFGATEPNDLPLKASTDMYEYIFDGWDKQFSFIETDLNVQIKYLAMIRKYTYTFYDDDQTTIIYQVTNTFGSPITIPSNPEKKALEFVRYEFIGWSPEIPKTLTQNIMFYANYEEIYKTYEVIFLNGNQSIIDKQIVEHGNDAIIPLTIPQKESTHMYDYTFEGYNLAYTNVVSNLIIEPVFSSRLKTFTVTFYDDLGNYLGDANITYGNSGVGHVATPTKKGHGFSGWSESINQVVKDMVVFAKFTPYAYQIIFDSNEADSGYIDPLTETFGNTIKLPENNLSKLGFEFNGWSLTKESEDIIYFDQEEIIFEEEGLMLYAKWSPIIYEINYDLDGGIANNPYSYTVLDELIINEAYKESHKFIGWEKTNLTKSRMVNLSKTEFIEVIEKGTIGHILLKAVYEYNGLIELKETSKLGMFTANITSILPVIERTNLGSNPVYLMGSMLGMTVADLRLEFKTQDLVFISNKGKTLKETDKVTSGTVIAVYDKVDLNTIKDSIEVIIKGDINGDGIISYLDINLLVNHVNGLRAIEAYRLLSALINTDKLVDYRDINLLINHINGQRPLAL